MSASWISGREMTGRWLAFFLLLSSSAWSPQVRVPRLVSDGMVLQRDLPLRIWGFASPGEKVTVKFAGETAGGVANDDGKWEIQLSPKKAGGPFTMDINGINHIWLKNIMVGEVWVLAGQTGVSIAPVGGEGEICRCHCKGRGCAHPPVPCTAAI